MEIKNLKTNFSLCQDPGGNSYAIDHVKYMEFFTDSPLTVYMIHPVGKDGVINYNAAVKMKRGDLSIIET